MGAQQFAIVADVSLRLFDDPAVGRRLVRQVIEELTGLGRADGRITRIKATSHRGRPLSVDLGFVVSADSAIEAFDLGSAVLRTAIHAAGGATVGWERLVPQVTQIVSAADQRRQRKSKRDRRPASVTARGDSSWSAAAANEARRAAALAPLPPFEAAPQQLIDLR